MLSAGSFVMSVCANRAVGAVGATVPSMGKSPVRSSRVPTVCGGRRFTR